MEGEGMKKILLILCFLIPVNAYSDFIEYKGVEFEWGAGMLFGGANSILEFSGIANDYINTGITGRHFDDYKLFNLGNPAFLINFQF